VNVPAAKAVLIRVANDSGGRDNISVLLVHAVEDDLRRSLLSRNAGKNSAADKKIQTQDVGNVPK
jgi:serine/threonine protein phosphatase PrpC